LLARSNLNTYWYQPHYMAKVEDASNLLQFLSPHFIPRENILSAVAPDATVILDKASESNLGLNLSFSLSGVEVKSEGLLSTTTTRTPWSAKMVVSFVYADIASFEIQNMTNDATPSPWCVIPLSRGPVGSLLCVPTRENAQQVIDALATLMVANGNTLGSYIGVSLAPVSEKELRKHPDRPQCEVADVSLEGPVAEAGIEDGDIVQTVNGSVCTADSLVAAVAEAGKKPEGGVLHLAVLRKKSALQIDVHYQNVAVDAAALRQQIADLSKPNPAPQPAAAPAAPAFHLGISGRAVTDSDLSATGLSKPKGVLVTNVEKGSIADQMQMQVGDVILQMNGADIGDAGAFAQLVRSGEAKGFRIWRKGKTLDLTIPQSM
jgi:hypothetical protein